MIQQVVDSNFCCKGSNDGLPTNRLSVSVNVSNDDILQRRMLELYSDGGLRKTLTLFHLARIRDNFRNNEALCSSGVLEEKPKDIP